MSDKFILPPTGVIIVEREAEKLLRASREEFLKSKRHLETSKELKCRALNLGKFYNVDLRRLRYNLYKECKEWHGRSYD